MAINENIRNGVKNMRLGEDEGRHEEQSGSGRQADITNRAQIMTGDRWSTAVLMVLASRPRRLKQSPGTAGIQHGSLLNNRRYGRRLGPLKNNNSEFNVRILKKIVRILTLNLKFILRLNSNLSERS